MILNLKDDILITHSFNFCSNMKMHGLSGHIFEIIDYYFILKKHFKVKCLIPELVLKSNFMNFINSHYDFKPDEIDINDFIFGNNFTAIKCKKILITDGGYWFLERYRSYLLGDVFAFSCGPSFLEPGRKPDYVTFLSDFKVYGKSNDIDYTKKILPRLKHIPGNRPFAHLTGNCRKLSKKLLEQLLTEYPEILIYSDYLEPNLNVTREPIKNFCFSEFIYTPISRHFDCSPRLIIECQLLGIPFKLWNIDYNDLGLERRLGDYKDFILKEDDEIIEILKFKNLKKIVNCNLRFSLFYTFN